MKRYKAHKDSGVEWIGEIPSNWSIRRLKNLVKVPLKYGANEAADEDDPSNPRYIRITDFGNDGKLRDDTFKSLKEEIAQDFLLEDGDLLFARSGATVGKTFLFSGYKGKACYAGYLIKASFPRQLVESRFVNYVTKSHYYENWKQSVFQQATIQNIGADKYNLFNVPIPPISEQNQIARYLDYKTAQIDALIEKKERLIALLEEERTALINEVVTGKKVWNGSEWTAPTETKDSGIEWLGEIPKEWNRARIKSLVSIKVCDGPHETPQWTERGVPFISAEAIKGNRINLDFRRGYISREQHEEYCKKSKVLKGDILFCKSGSTTGKSAIVEFDTEFGIWSPLAIIRANSVLVNNEFMFQSVQSSSFRNQVETSWTFGTQPNIGMGALENLWIAIPPRESQNMIATFLNEQLQKFESLETKLTSQISLLKEYKTALISEVVTGKIDVRDEVVPHQKVAESVL